MCCHNRRARGLLSIITSIWVELINVEQSFEARFMTRSRQYFVGIHFSLIPKLSSSSSRIGSRSSKLPSPSSSPRHQLSRLSSGKSVIGVL